MKHNGHDEPEYPQPRRVLKVLDRLHQSGPQSPEDLAESIGLVYRSASRFMNAMQEAGWPVYVRKDNASARGLWALDSEKLVERFTPKKKRNATR